MLRCRAAIALLAVVAATLVAPSMASAADSVGTIDRDVVALDSSGTSFTRTSGPQDVVSASVSSTNQIVLTTADPAAQPLTLSLGDGTRPQPGGYYLLNSTTKNRITGICGGTSGGHLAVDRVVYSGDTVVELSASYGTSCSALGYSSGAIRVGVTDPYAVVRPPTATMGRVPGGRLNVTTVRFANTGDGATGTLEPATVGTNIVGVTDFSIVADGCGGRALAPGEACTVGVGFRRDTSGTSTSLVRLRDATYPGRQLVTGITATAVPLPSPVGAARPFPVRGGQGIAWWAASGEVDHYRVEADDAGTWTDVSGPLTAGTRTWVDTTLTRGASRSYRVIATNLAGDATPSPVTTATRADEDAALGDVRAISIDSAFADPGPYGTPPQRVARDAQANFGFPQASQPGWGWTTLTAGALRAELPPFLPGPGRYRLGAYPTDGDFTSVFWRGCSNPSTATLDVESVSYTAAGALESLGAVLHDVCNGLAQVTEIRFNTPTDVTGLTVSPGFAVLPETRVGETSARSRIDVENIGGVPVQLGARALDGVGGGDWVIASDTCGSVIEGGASCAIEVQATPSRGGDRNLRLDLADSTLLGTHSSVVNLHATGIPTAPTDVAAVRLPFGGVDLTWDWPTDAGGQGATRWVVRRQSGGTQTVADGNDRYWSDPTAPEDATYSVAMENSLGSGPASAPIAPTAAADVLAVKDNVLWGAPTPRLAGIAVDGGQQTVPWRVPGLPDPVVAAAASPDGRSLATVRWGADGGYELWRHPVDNSAPPVKVWSTTSRVVTVAWSPDGTRFAIGTTVANNCCPVGMVVLDATTGKVVASVADVDWPAWLPDSRTLVARDDLSNTLIRVDAASGRRLGPLAGAPVGWMPTVSPDGRWLAYRSLTVDQIAVAPLAGGPARTVALVGAGRPQWAPDARSFVVSAYSAYSVGTYRVAVGPDGTPGTPARLSLVGGGEPEVLAWAGRRVAIGAIPPLTGPVATVPVVMTSFPAGTTLSCAVDSGAFVPCTTSWRTPSLTTGIHTVRVRTVEPDGRTTVAARTIVVDATAPIATTTALPLATLATTTTLRFSATDTGGSTVASYDVRYRYATPGGGFTAVSQPAGWQGLTSTSRAFTLGKGYSYCFSVRARDALGNVGVWTAETCTNVALDDISLSGTGWSRGTSSAYYLGTYTFAAVSGRVLSARVSSRQVGIVVTNCSTCGVVDVRLAGAYLGRKSLASATTHAKQILWLPYGVTRTGTLSLTTVGAKRVYVDGVVLRH